MTGWPLMPGVPAAGHVTRGGHWHPGAELTCTRGPCSADYGAPMHTVTFPVGGHGESYCPYCASTLVTFDLDPAKVQQQHMRECGHSGRPRQINRALRLAQLSRTDVKD